MKILKPQKEPIHINAKREDIAENVIFPGDPLRAKYIAEKYLTDYKEVTNVRNMLGFTGYYKGKKITVMGSGMGMPSAGIYAFELFYFYNVQKIIRIGTCGTDSENVNLLDIILADKIYSESNYAYTYNGFEGNVVYPANDLINKIMKNAEEKKVNVIKGTMMTCDVFTPYVDVDAISKRIPSDLEVLAEDMEGYGVVHVANSFNRQAAVIATVVDSKFSDRLVSVEDRETSLDIMIRLALDSLI